MNSIAAANLLENPLVLVAILLFGALSNWLLKRRRQAGTNASGGERESPPSPGEQGRSTRQPDWQDVLSQLLGGQPPPQAPPPPPLPLPRASRDGQISPVRGDEEQSQPEQRWMEEPQGGYEKARPPANQAAARSGQHAALALASATRTAAKQSQEEATRQAAQLSRQPKHPAGAVRTAHGRHSSGHARSVSLWREPRTVRRAFIASLVFAPPKGLET